MLSNPLISFCIPMYNAEAYIAQTLLSIQNQDYNHFEIIVIDDYSTDSSRQIVYETSLEDKRIKLYSNLNRGAASARNQAYKKSTGHYIIFFDADDWIPKNFIETQLETLIAKSDVAVAKWGRFDKNDLSTIQIDKYQIEKDLTFEEWILTYWNNNSNMTCPGRVVIPRKVIELSGLWDENLTLNDDFEFYTRIFSNCNIIRYNNHTLFYYRSGINGLSSRKGHQARLSLYKSVCDSIAIAKSVLESNDKLNKSYANLLQGCVYEIYPFEKELTMVLETQISELGESDYPFPAGGKTKQLSNLIGWKITKRLKSYFNF